ncbi:efflux transporter outer membrane subunit [Burkholderia seminalis]|uniref:efflux transporter outer membrane subunit n=1 Tax=Burkholderia seminalis TaxID=488731 RepID=UPI00190422EF|nr:efflux transporter outer membrane subunit [Burkholderia seminalis]MBJ9592011.1 efflux transporter outer membrane subunit [Burkholderia seminalis]
MHAALAPSPRDAVALRVLSRTAVAVALALLGACASRDGLAPAGTLRGADTLAASRSLAHAPIADWPAADWWLALHDAQLDALIDEALAGNPDLATADARAREAQALVIEAQAARLPHLVGRASAKGERTSGTQFSTDQGGGVFSHTREINLGLSWDLDLWGGRRATWEAALGEARAARIDAQAARVLLSVNVARAYVNLAYAFDQQDVAQAEFDRADEALSLTRQRVTKGIDNVAQQRQAESEVAAATREQARAAQAIDSARIALAILLGAGPDRGLALARPAPLPTAALAVPADLPAGLLGRRADLVAARWRVEAASRNVAAARADFLPDVSLTALIGLATRGGASLFQAASRTYNVNPAVSLPIFDGGERRGVLRKRDAQYDLAVAGYNKTLIGAIGEVADDLHRLRSLAQQADAQQRAFDSAADAWRLADARYRAGVGSYLDALVVRQQLLIASREVAALRAQRADQSLQLVAALGGGFRAEPDDVALAATPSHRP